MNTYFGQISIRNEYVNFRPMYRFENGHFNFLNYEELSTLFPDTYKGEINFICEGIFEEKKFKDKEYLFLNIEEDSLEDNVGPTGRNRTGYKISVSKTERKRVNTPDDKGYYCILTESDYEGDYQKSSSLTILNDNVYPGLKVLIKTKNENEFLGPFEIVESSIGNDRLIIQLRNNDQKQLSEGLRLPSDADTQYLGWRGEQLFFANANDAEHFRLDSSTDEQLLASFLSTLSEEFTDDGKIDISTAVNILESHKKSLFVGIPEEIREKRFTRLKRIITDEKNLITNVSSISSLFCSFLDQNKKSEQYNQLIEELTKKPEFMEKIQRFKIVQEKIDSEEQKLQELHNKYDSLKKDIDAKDSEKADALLEDKKQEVSDLLLKKESLQQEINNLEEICNLNEKVKSLTDDVRYKERRINELKDISRELEKSFSTFFEESAKRVVKFNFDGMLADKVTQIASEWKKDDEHKRYKEIVSNLKNEPHLAQTGDDLVTYLIEKVKEFRPNYRKNDILNILICFAQGFLTVFSGEPGIGKTSICNILANAFGLNSYKEKNLGYCRFIQVSVERGWTTKRDFVGYFNPLTKNFDKSNRKIFDALNILDIESRDPEGSDTPFAILLDEANLSPMEYYWADFMNVCDDFENDKTINLGDDFTFKIAKCMRFFATINNDHTTESLSPRLIDRAWVIRLPESRNILLGKTILDNNNQIISWKEFYKVFSGCYGKNKIDGVAGNIFDELLKKCKDAKINVSPRVINAISKYWFTAQNLFESKETDASIIALDYAIAQRILTHINGNGQTYKDKLIALQDFCNQNNLQMSSEIIKDIIQKGVESMQYFQYFA